MITLLLHSCAPAREVHVQAQAQRAAHEAQAAHLHAQWEVAAREAEDAAQAPYIRAYYYLVMIVMILIS